MTFKLTFPYAVPSTLIFYFENCSNREKRMEIFCKFVKNMDDNMRNMLQIGHDSRKKHLGRKYLTDTLHFIIIYLHVFY